MEVLATLLKAVGLVPAVLLFWSGTLLTAMIFPLCISVIAHTLIWIFNLQDSSGS